MDSENPRDIAISRQSNSTYGSRKKEESRETRVPMPQKSTNGNGNRNRAQEERRG